MQIDGKTKISDLIRHDKRVIEVLAGLDNKLAKLKNPILRKVLARRVNINEAASMVGLDPEVFFNALYPLGFRSNVPKDEKEKKMLSDKETQMQHEEINLSQFDIVKLDVRPILERGEDPFDEIMTFIKALGKDQALEVSNTFEPIPMINVLKSKGFSSHTVRNKPGEVKCYFYKIPGQEEKGNESFILRNDPVAFHKTLDRFGDKLKEVDVRELEMPMPMVVILQEIEDLKKGHALFVFHKKFPQFLLEELKQRGFNLISKEMDESNTHLLIYRK